MQNNLNKETNSSNGIDENIISKPSHEFIKEEVLCTGKWLALKNVTYKDHNGIARTWEMASRTTKCAGSADGVSIIPILRRTLHFDCLVCVKQYRPTFRTYSLEFPAGLLDAGETPEVAARRELKEETGYVAKEIKFISPPTSLDAGIESCTIVFVTAEIDGDDVVNHNPKQELEETECIEVIHIPINDVMNHVSKHAQDGTVVDSRIYTYAFGMQAAMSMTHRNPAPPPPCDK